jgi:glycine betaine/proline transport system permease protein
MVLTLAVLLAHAAGLRISPPDTLLPLASWIGIGTDWFTEAFRPVFRAITYVMTGPMKAMRTIIEWLTWPSVIVIGAALGLAAGGWKLGVFCGLSLLYIVVAGYWDKTAVTLSLLTISAPVAITAGLFLGIWSWRSRVADRLISPLLDFMQTVPTFAYLVPILVMFGIGPVVGMIASGIYAIPPMVHSVKLALRKTQTEMIESARMAGSTNRQLLWWVMLPAAVRTVLVGVNQTVMASLSMVVIASMVGGVDDIGIEVFQSMKQAKFGESLLSGLVIALLAMMMDRITRGFATPRRELDKRPSAKFWIFVLIIVFAFQLLALHAEAIARYPDSWIVNPSSWLNHKMQSFTVAVFPITSAIKSFMVFAVMLPVKIGFAESVRPSFWGFEMTPTVSFLYCAFAIAGTATILALRGTTAALLVAMAATLYFCGTTGIPWPAMAALIIALAWRIGGPETGFLAVFGVAFIVTTGSWSSAMVSLQLCLVGVALAFVLGSAIGIWAALDSRVSAVVNPVCDTLQTMPIFVFLIPAVMVFLVGEFTALIAVVMYAIVPAIRYTELGIRNVPHVVTEAAQMIGANRWQKLSQIELPVATPEIALGLNQTIMMALAMVIVASLVGAQGLGSEVMVALSRADVGKGLVAGICVSLIAIIADRTLQAWASERRRVLGLA